jgi:hypothetical protein
MANINLLVEKYKNQKDLTREEIATFLKEKKRYMQQVSAEQAAAMVYYASELNCTEKEFNKLTTLIDKGNLSGAEVVKVTLRHRDHLCFSHLLSTLKSAQKFDERTDALIQKYVLTVAASQDPGASRFATANLSYLFKIKKADTNIIKGVLIEKAPLQLVIDNIKPLGFFKALKQMIVNLFVRSTPANYSTDLLNRIIGEEQASKELIAIFLANPWFNKGYWQSINKEEEWQSLFTYLHNKLGTNDKLYKLAEVRYETIMRRPHHALPAKVVNQYQNAQSSVKSSADVNKLKKIHTHTGPETRIVTKAQAKQAKQTISVVPFVILSESTLKRIYKQLWSNTFTFIKNFIIPDQIVRNRSRDALPLPSPIKEVTETVSNENELEPSSPSIMHSIILPLDAISPIKQILGGETLSPNREHTAAHEKSSSYSSVKRKLSFDDPSKSYASTTQLQNSDRDNLVFNDGASYAPTSEILHVLDGKSYASTDELLNKPGMLKDDTMNISLPSFNDDSQFAPEEIDQIQEKYLQPKEMNQKKAILLQQQTEAKWQEEMVKVKKFDNEIPVSASESFGSISTDTSFNQTVNSGIGDTNLSMSDTETSADQSSSNPPSPSKRQSNGE